MCSVGSPGNDTQLCAATPQHVRSGKPQLLVEFSRGTLMWTATGAALAGATAGILVAAYFDGIAAIIVETVSSAKRPRTRVRPMALA